MLHYSAKMLDNIMVNQLREITIKMLNDRDIKEENDQLLVPRWRMLIEQRAKTDAMRLGMTPLSVEYISSLDEIQIKRASDCSSPLFYLSQPSDVIAKLLTAGVESDIAPFDDLDRLVQNENYVVLLNRWASVRTSVVHAQCTFGLSAAVVRALQGATIKDIKSASQKGIRLVSLAPRPKYFFHAGRNIRLQRSMRTALAVCSSSRAFF